MHYDSNKKLYIAGLCVFIVLVGFLIGHMLRSDNFQSLYTNDTIIANTYSGNKKNVSPVLGDKKNLIAFSIVPYEKLHGVVDFRGSVKGAYFFEGNILINVLDADKQVIKNSNAMATTDWMTAGPVRFEGSLDFTNFPKGPAYIEIHNDNASGLPEHDKSILIPIIIE